MTGWHEGGTAFREGRAIEECPYFTDPLRAVWRMGWSDARDAAERQRSEAGSGADPEARPDRG
jgi:ribosome modulation factor